MGDTGEAARVIAAYAAGQHRLDRGLGDAKVGADHAGRDRRVVEKRLARRLDGYAPLRERKDNEEGDEAKDRRE